MNPDGAFVYTPNPGFTGTDSFTYHLVDGTAITSAATVTLSVATALSAVTLSAAPSAPQPVNTPIKLTASATGGYQVTYLFRAGYTDSAGWHWSDVNFTYATTATCTWTPKLPTTYTLVVWARNTGETGNYDKYATFSYQVTPQPFTAVALAATPASPQAINTPVTLTATPTGGSGQVQYLFRVGYADTAGWHWTNITSGYSTTATCNWIPTSTGAFTLEVWARLIGHTANYDQYASRSYQVTPQPLSAVALAVTPGSPQPVTTPVTLSATPTGGGNQVQYLFRVGYVDPAGWHWANLTASYTASASCSWRPATVGTFTLVVWARLLGHTANYDQYASLTYQVTPQPLTAVALTANPPSPQPVTTPVTLNATPTGGSGQVQYLFRVGYEDATGWHWTNLTTSYTSTASCSWTPASVRTYTLVVWARLRGHTTNFDQYASLTYLATPPPLSAVTLAVTPSSPRPANTPVTLTATPTGGGQVTYLFRVGYEDAAGWHWSNLTTSYTTSASCTWTPTAAGTYTLVVWARLLGHTANYDRYASLSYQVTPQPLTAVALAVNPASPQPVYSTITLTATPTGGSGQVQYLFRAGYEDAAGWHWSNINASYSTAASCSWTPTTAGAYTLVVWARLIGHSADYDRYASLTYQVTSQ